LRGIKRPAKEKETGQPEKISINHSDRQAVILPDTKGFA
jgi:hypothetical protein